MDYGLPVMEKVRPMLPEAYDPHKHEKRKKLRSGHFNTYPYVIEAGKL